MTKKQRRMKKAVTMLQAYIATYDQQQGYLNYSDKTFIDDVLYGLGIALDAEHQAADGYEIFRSKLRKHLG